MCLSIVFGAAHRKQLRKGLDAFTERSGAVSGFLKKRFRIRPYAFGAGAPPSSVKAGKVRRRRLDRIRVRVWNVQVLWLHCC